MGETFIRVNGGMLVNLRHVQSFGVLDSKVMVHAPSYYDVEDWDHWLVAECGSHENAVAYLDLVADALADLTRIHTGNLADQRPSVVIDLRDLT